MEYWHLAVLVIVVIVVLFIRSRIAYYKPIVSEQHYRTISEWVESVLKKGQVPEPTVEDGTGVATDEGVTLAFTRIFDDEYDCIQFSISQRSGHTTRAVGGRFIFLVLQLLGENRCEADFFYTPSGVHHVTLRKPLGGEWKVGSIEEAIRKMEDYRPLPLEERDPATGLPTHAPQSAAIDELSKDQVTKAGCLFFGVMIGVLTIGYAQETLAPESRFGEFVSTDTGKWIFGGTVVGIFGVINMILSRAGIETFRAKDD